MTNRWTILFFSVLSMVAVANFQYGWTLLWLRCRSSSTRTRRSSR